MQAQTESFSQTSDWFYESARSRPLLNKTQEQETDTAKWQALYAIFDLITKDPAGQSLLQSWANNLVNNPPDLVAMPERKHYFALTGSTSRFLRVQETARCSSTLRGAT